MKKEVNITKGNCDHCLGEYDYKEKKKQYENLYYIHIGKKEFNLCGECLLKLQKRINEFVNDEQIERKE